MSLVKLDQYEALSGHNDKLWGQAAFGRVQGSQEVSIQRVDQASTACLKIN